MTYQEVCEAHIRKTRPEVTDPEEIRKLALAFFNASPSGELWHVHAAADEMRGPGPIVSGIVELPSVAQLGDFRDYECGPEGATFKDGERTVYAAPAHLARRSSVRVQFSADGWELMGVGPNRLVSDEPLRFNGQDSGRVTFRVVSGEVLRLEANGEIFVHGRLAATDLEVVDAMREFLRASGNLR